MNGTSIQLWMRVALQNEVGQVWRVELVHPDQADPEHHKISIASPVGRALLGHKAGEEITVRACGAGKGLLEMNLGRGFEASL